jgi:NADPH-dependent 2,4-dienoyl-CoA reductase/sulfur reductase-like enzyme
VQRALDAIVDVMRVAASGDPALAVLPVARLAPEHTESCEVLIAGGGTGGVAAALAAARAGRSVVLLEETDWIGGQMTAQGVSALMSTSTSRRSAAPAATTSFATQFARTTASAIPATAG